MFKDHNGHEFA
jgi:hypothetical protein